MIRQLRKCVLLFGVSTLPIFFYRGGSHRTAQTGGSRIVIRRHRIRNLLEKKTTVTGSFEPPILSLILVSFGKQRNKAQPSSPKAQVCISSSILYISHMPWHVGGFAYAWSSRVTRHGASKEKKKEKGFLSLYIPTKQLAHVTFHTRNEVGSELTPTAMREKSSKNACRDEEARMKSG